MIPLLGKEVKDYSIILATKFHPKKAFQWHLKINGFSVSIRCDYGTLVLWRKHPQIIEIGCLFTFSETITESIKGGQITQRSFQDLFLILYFSWILFSCCLNRCICIYFPLFNFHFTLVFLLILFLHLINILHFLIPFLDLGNFVLLAHQSQMENSKQRP